MDVSVYAESVSIETTPTGVRTRARVRLDLTPSMSKVIQAGLRLVEKMLTSAYADVSVYAE